MTDADVIAYWREGAHDELVSAEILHEAGQYAAALFHCHLAVEKALKAAIMENTGNPHPKIHNLRRLALLIHDNWPPEDADLFDLLSSFSVAARYDDPTWASRYATLAHTSDWLERVRAFLSRHVP